MKNAGIAHKSSQPEEYFATCTISLLKPAEIEKAAKQLRPAEKVPSSIKATSRATSADKAPETRFLTKVQTLIRPAVQQRRGPSEEIKQPISRANKAATMHTISVVKPEAKKAGESAKSSARGGKECSSADSKPLSVRLNEAKLIKSSLIKKEQHPARKTTGTSSKVSKFTATQTFRSSNLNPPASAHSTSRPAVGSRVRSREQELRPGRRNQGQSSGESSCGRHDTSGSAQRGNSPGKNPEYFELQRKATATAGQRGKSPAAAKDVAKVSFNIKKILATLKADGRGSASRPKNKASPVQPKTRFRQVASAR